MSTEQQKTIGTIVNWALKVAFGIAAFLMVDVFSDMKDDVKTIGKDMQSIKESVIRLEDKVQRNTDDIIDMKTAKRR